MAATLSLSMANAFLPGPFTVPILPFGWKPVTGLNSPYTCRAWEAISSLESAINNKANGLHRPIALPPGTVLVLCCILLRIHCWGRENYLLKSWPWQTEKGLSSKQGLKTQQPQLICSGHLAEPLGKNFHVMETWGLIQNLHTTSSPRIARTTVFDL